MKSIDWCELRQWKIGLSTYRRKVVILEWWSMTAMETSYTYSSRGRGREKWKGEGGFGAAHGAGSSSQLKSCATERLKLHAKLRATKIARNWTGLLVKSKSGRFRENGPLCKPRLDSVSGNRKFATPTLRYRPRESPPLPSSPFPPRSATFNFKCVTTRCISDTLSAIPKGKRKGRESPLVKSKNTTHTHTNVGRKGKTDKKIYKLRWTFCSLRLHALHESRKRPIDSYVARLMLPLPFPSPSPSPLMLFVIIGYPFPIFWLSTPNKKALSLPHI